MNADGRPSSPTGAPPVMRNTRPRTSTMVPSVVMNGLTPSLAMIRPLARPTAAPAAMPASTPAAMPNFTITIAATQPASATVEPTERSKPPPMMTKVMPMAITAMIEDCTRMLVRLSGDRKRSVSSAVTTHSATSVMSGIWPARLKRLGIVIRRSRRAAASRRSHRARSSRAVMRPRCKAQMLSQTRVSSARSLELTSTPPPRLAKSRISAWICALAATSTPCVGSSSSSTPTLRASHLARITFCWLPPDSAAARSDASRGRMSSSSISSATSRSPAARSMRPPRVSRSRLGSRMLSRTERFITRPSRRSPGTMPMPARIASVGRASRATPALVRTWLPAASRPNSRRSTRSVPLPSRPASPSTSLARRRIASGRSVGIFERDIARHQRIGRDAGLGAAGHGLHQIGDGERAALAVRRHPAVAQHGAAVGQRHHLVEPVRDVDDRGALLLHAREHREQPLDLAGLERRRRLVEDQQPAAPAQRLGDGDKLALGESSGGRRACRGPARNRAAPRPRAPARASRRGR